MNPRDREAARDYLNAALHPFGCKANRMVMTGGVTDPLFCDCGLEALRRINAAYHGDTVAADPRRCSVCGTTWTADEALPCPKCSGRPHIVEGPYPGDAVAAREAEEFWGSVSKRSGRADTQKASEK